MTGRRRIFLIVFCVFIVMWAMAIHFCFLIAVPDPIFAPDSGGYASPALHLLFGKSFDLDSQRTPFYSIFLYAVLKATHRFLGVLMVQHGLSLLTGGIAAFLYYRNIWKSCAGAAVVFFLSAALPLPAIYAHYILTENLYTFFLVGSICLMLLGHEKRSKRYWALAGIMIASAILTRPIGRALFAMILFVPVLEHAKRAALKSWLCGVTSAAGILLIAIQKPSFTMS